MTLSNLTLSRRYSLTDLTLNAQENAIEIGEVNYSSSTNESFTLCRLCANESYISFDLKPGIDKHLKELNRILHNLFPNCYIHIFSANGNYTLKCASQEYVFSPNTDGFPDQITLQGRSFDDFCVKLINLSQNFRWSKEVQNHNY